MAFHALEVACALASALWGPLEQVRKHDKDLADQMRRATSSVALCVGEARKRAGRDQAHLFRVAAGSAAEVATALRLAIAWGYVGEEQVAEARVLLAREESMLWRLTHLRGSTGRG